MSVMMLDRSRTVQLLGFQHRCRHDDDDDDDDEEEEDSIPRLQSYRITSIVLEAYITDEKIYCLDARATISLLRILVNVGKTVSGRNLFSEIGQKNGRTCRLFQTPSWLLREKLALLSASPDSILFVSSRTHKVYAFLSVKISLPFISLFRSFYQIRIDLGITLRHLWTSEAGKPTLHQEITRGQFRQWLRVANQLRDTLEEKGPAPPCF
uniref:Uncharacterized protein n=1 Tax=Vespula pensylvanica TaxID=30213 RepID=A0A834UE12_VESPE|nr:hypothetical protein H0235_002464 [Vespula pensylvanica]